MSMRKTHDAVFAGEKYTDRDGNEKTRFINMGALFQRDDGSMCAKIESIPVGFTGWVSFYEPRDKQQSERPQRPQRSAPPADEPNDDIPF